jgi:hypothetical protein
VSEFLYYISYIALIRLGVQRRMGLRKIRMFEFPK